MIRLFITFFVCLFNMKAFRKEQSTLNVYSFFGSNYIYAHFHFHLYLYLYLTLYCGHIYGIVLCLFLFCLLGFSDPYVMLGIQPGGTPISPLPPMTPRTLSDVGFDNNLDSPHHSDKLRKHHSFRLSFKRKDGRREHRDSLNGPVPAKFIRATSIKSHTLSPKWHEKFKLYVTFCSFSQHALTTIFLHFLIF